MSVLKENISRVPFLSTAILVSGLAFLYKGISYLVIGSVVPFVLSLIVMLCVVIAFKSQSKRSRRMFRIWGWLLFFWGVARLSVELLFVFAPVTETHIREQFVWPQKILSLLAVALGIYIIRKAKTFEHTRHR